MEKKSVSREKQAVPSGWSSFVEIENTGDLGIGAGFVVEKADVKIGGEGAKVAGRWWV
jgi:hypothetical protein